jgi:hypothetical protein
VSNLLQCDRCGVTRKPDNKFWQQVSLGGSGGVFLGTGDQYLHLCRSCSGEWKKLFKQFVEDGNP